MNDTLLLYSTNTFMKYVIQQQYRNDRHYVWCSEFFDASTLSPYNMSARVGRSSNPADIYRELQRDVDSRDDHSAKIASQKSNLLSLAIQWEAAHEITPEEKDEIIDWVESRASFSEWRPLLYIIPRAPVEQRLQVVPPARRAGFGREYIIPDLHSDEFHVIEF